MDEIATVAYGVTIYTSNLMAIWVEQLIGTWLIICNDVSTKEKGQWDLMLNKAKKKTLAERTQLKNTSVLLLSLYDSFILST